jgi:hypothetical protein
MIATAGEVLAKRNDELGGIKNRPYSRLMLFAKWVIHRKGCLIMLPIRFDLIQQLSILQRVMADLFKRMFGPAWATGEVGQLTV